MADAVDVAERPGDLDCVTDRAFNAGRRRFEFLGNSRVQRFGDGSQDFNIVVHHRNGLA
ncbi:hypothetical protein D3C71_2246590 [compost metagenome]